MPAKDSPPPFSIRFRARGPGEPPEAGEPRPADAAGEAGEPADRLYQRALELTALVAALADDLAVARFHVRDRLDRGATQLALLCHRAAAERAPAARRRVYREARPHAHECAALLDIVGLRLRRAGKADQVITEAQGLLADIAAALDLLASR
ncbi:MAG TPA: hypothetical protein VK932_31065 [Kofleriaceae bacterium]|nr:hypothetical protein [Kofleriaceae bacterium]